MSNRSLGFLAGLLWCLLTFNLSAASLEDLSYSVVGEEVHITECSWEASGTLDIPSIIEGKPVTRLLFHSFRDCKNLEKVHIPDSVTTIEESAFDQCINLTEVTIGKGLASLGAWALNSDCDRLKFITVHPENPHFSSLHGVLYNKSQTTLLVVPEATTGLLVIPKSVTTIGLNALDGCRDIAEILFNPLQAPITPKIKEEDDDPFWALSPEFNWNGVFQAAYILPNAQGYDAIGYESLTIVTMDQNKQDTTPPALKLLGSAMMTLTDGETYMEAGVMVENVYDQAYGYELVTEGSINNAVPGDYTLTYIATDEADNEARITRTIRVVDTPPSLTLIGSGMLNHEAGQPYEEQGATAVDMIDGSVEVTISGKVDENTKPGTYILTYTAKDSVGNVATITRNVEVVDTVRPTITLLHRPDHRASSSIDLFERTLGDFIDPGAEASDTVDGTIEFSSISIDGNVDTLTLGDYELIYTATDKAGNEASVTRNVRVVDRTPPTLRLIGDEVIEIEAGKDYTDSGAEVFWDALDSSGTVIVTTGGAVGNQVVNSDGNPVSQVITNIDFKDNVGRDRTFGTAVVYKALAVGSYTIEYGASDESGNYGYVSRKIKVIPDVTPPEITLIGEAWNDIYVSDIDGFYKQLKDWAPGATAVDAVDGSIKVEILEHSYIQISINSERTFKVWHRDISSPGLYAVVYQATDSSGNTAVAYRKVQVVQSGDDFYTEEELITADFEPPTITLNGPENVYVNVGEPQYNYAIGWMYTSRFTSGPEHVYVNVGKPYKEQGATAKDAEGGTVEVSIRGSVDTSIMGVHEITYIAKDRFGIQSSATRYVYVIDPNATLFFKVSGDEARVVRCTRTSSGNVIIPSSWEGKPVTSIEDNAFENCILLKSVIIGDRVTSIGSQTFDNCYNLRSVIIGDRVTSIGRWAFYNCRQLTSVTFEGNAPTLGSDVFYWTHRGGKVYVGANATGFGTIFGGLPVVREGSITTASKGNTSDGPIMGAVVFFDANLNGLPDEGEPQTTSNGWGDYWLDIPLETYDLNGNGMIDISEGVIVSQGGTDTATGLPVKTTLKGPASATVITPLTTLVTRVMEQNPELDASAAADKLEASLGIPAGVDILSFDTFREASEENPSAADVLTATAKLQDTLVQGGNLIGGATGKSLQEGSDAVMDAIAQQVKAGNNVDLDSKGSLKSLITEAASTSGANLTEAQTDGAASIMEASSKAKEDAKAAASTVTELATEVSRVQAVSQSKAAADLEAVGAGTANLGATVQAYTGSSFEQQVRTEVVGDFTGSSGEAPVFAFQSASYTVNEDGQQQPIIQINRTGDSIESVDLRVTPVGLSATAGEDFKGDPITVRFESLEIRKTLDLVALLLDDSLPEAEETLYLELSVVEGLEELEGLETSPRVGEQKRATLSIRDNDVVDEISFANKTNIAFEDWPGNSKVLIQRTGGSGRVTVWVTPRGLDLGAQAGLDFDESPIEVIFPTGELTQTVTIPIVNDDEAEDSESLYLELSLGDNAPEGAVLGRESTTLLVILSDPRDKEEILMGPSDLRIQLKGQNVVFSWEGKGALQTATSLQGPYTNLPGEVTSPYTWEATGDFRFFRVIP
ncbi:DUF5011 domain-containing protein [Verrucomicrobia bacterium]|nr:DUF5011 domain-containing protein [Verrucomicrobiota bacterium]